ncbi:effector of murein hydrolase [Erwinia tracheiphila PSU-1]|nr:effector of murein hydrolase [Erwinia tracheiphila PSU-1]
MNGLSIGVRCLFATLLIYCLNKRLYRCWHRLIFMPLVMTTRVLVALLVIAHISWQNYISESRWLLWLPGPATLAFAVPVYTFRKGTGSLRFMWW